MYVRTLLCVAWNLTSYLRSRNPSDDLAFVTSLAAGVAG